MKISFSIIFLLKTCLVDLTYNQKLVDVESKDGQVNTTEINDGAECNCPNELLIDFINMHEWNSITVMYGQNQGK